MKKLFIILAATLLLGGCASSMPMGTFYTDLSLPLTATSNSGTAKTGTAGCKSYLGLVATGDCSIETAKKNGGISKVTNVDWKAHNVLGLFGEYQLIVKGE